MSLYSAFCKKIKSEVCRRWVSDSAFFLHFKDPPKFATENWDLRILFCAYTISNLPQELRNYFFLKLITADIRNCYIATI